MEKMITFIKKPVFLIFALAFFLRLGYGSFFLGLNTPPNEHDFWQEKIAFNLYEGNGYVITKNQPTARKLPMFPISISAVYTVFGHNLIAARLFLILLGAFSAVGVYMIAKIFYQEKEAVIAGILLALDPLYIYLSGWLLNENLYMFLIVWFIYFLARYQSENKDIKYLVYAGALFGLAVLTRANILITSVLLFIWSWFVNKPDKTKAVKDTLIISGIMCLFLSFWVIRNYSVFDDFILTETGSGRMFWGSNNPDAIGDVILLTGSPRMYEEKERPKGTEGTDWRKWEGSPWLNMFLSTIEGQSEKAVNKKYFKKGTDWIKKNPVEFIKLLPGKIFYFWKFWSPHASFPDLEPYQWHIARTYYYIIFPLFLVGLFTSFKTWEKHLILYIIIFNFTISTMIFFGDARQRMPIIPVMAILAGSGLRRMYDKRKDT